jgi:hypothetical protein
MVRAGFEDYAIFTIPIRKAVQGAGENTLEVSRSHHHGFETVFHLQL